MRPISRTAIALSMAACVGLSACSSSPAWRFDGASVSDLSLSLSGIETQWRASLAALGPTVNLPDDAHCYAQQTGEDTIGKTVICGPVRIAGDGRTTWQSHAVEAVASQSGVGLGLGQARAGFTTAGFQPRAEVGFGARFVDVDGVAAPVDQDLDPPPLDRANADQPLPLTATITGGTQISARTPTGPVSLTVKRTSSTIGPAGRQSVPPVGGSFVLLESSALPDAATGKDGLTVMVSHDGKDVSLPVAQLDAGLSVGLPQGARDVTIEVGWDGKTQAFDAATGKRLGNPAASLYDELGDTASASCPPLATVTPTSGAATPATPTVDGWRQQFYCLSTLTRSSYLAAPEAGSPRRIEGWAADGMTWVELSLEPYEQSTYVKAGVTTSYAPTYFSFGTRLRVAGVDHTPKQLYVEQAEGVRPARVTAIFEVPSGQRSMALHSFVTTNLIATKANPGMPLTGAFTYVADNTFTFGYETP